ncbi:hypothetical protein Tco_0265316 [Tanacetum coccineum]
MMLLAQAITQKFSTPTNNRLRTLSDTRNQAVIQDGRVDIQTKNTRYGGNSSRNAGKPNRNQAFNAGNMIDESNQIVQRVPRTESNPRKANVQEQMLLAMKDKAGSNLNTEQNDFMLDNSFGDVTLEELTSAVIMMAQIQPADGNAVTKPTYDAKAISEVNASHKAHEQVNHVKRKTIIHASDDDQIDSNNIFDDPYVENNGGTSEHDLTDHDEYHNIQILAYNAQREAENQKRLNNELKNQKELLQKELGTCKEWVKTFESKTVQVLSAAKVLADAAKKNVNTYTRRRRAVSTGSEGVSTVSRIFSTVEESVSTVGASMPVSTAGMVQQVNIIIPTSSETTKDKGKAIMQESEQPKKIKKRVQIQMTQIQVDEDLAQKLLEEERENLSIEERARLLAELIDKKKKLQAAQRYEAIRNKPQTMSQQRKTMCTYMKNMARYKIDPHSIERTKRAGLNLQEESSKRQKTGEGSEPTEELKADDISQEDLQQMIMSYQRNKINVVKALQSNNPIIDMGDDLDKLWSLVKERFSSTDPTNDKERTLCVELKRLFEPNTDDIMWNLKRTIIPQTKRALTLMLCNKLQVDQYSEMTDGLLRKIVNHKFRGGLLGIKGFYKFLLLVQLSIAKRRFSINQSQKLVQLFDSDSTYW